MMASKWIISIMLLNCIWKRNRRTTKMDLKIIPSQPPNYIQLKVQTNSKQVPLNNMEFSPQINNCNLEKDLCHNVLIAIQRLNPVQKYQIKS